jgi:outer membrane protein, heavy metal efflux system
MKRKLVVTILGILLSTATAQAETLVQLQQEALENNSAVQAAHASWQAYEAQATQQGWWPNPKLKMSFMNLPGGEWNFSRTPMSGKQLMLMQKIPFWKAPLRGGAGAAKARAAQAQWQSKRWEIRQTVTQMVVQLMYLQEAQQILQKHQKLIQRLAKVARVKYEGGRGLEQDVLRAEVELALLDNQLLEINEKQHTAHAKLKALLSRSQDLAISIEDKIRWQARVVNPSELMQKAKKNNPKMKQLEAQVESSRLQRRIADEDWIPDLELSGYYTWREEIRGDPVRGEDFMGVSAGIELPLFFLSQEVPASRAASARHEQKTKQLQAWEDALSAKVTGELKRIERLAASQTLYQTRVLPQAKAALDSSLTAYQTGRVEFLTVVNNESMLVKHEIKYYKIIAEYEQAIADLESLLANELKVVQEEGK